MRLKVVAYNPLYAGIERMHDIQQEFNSFHFVILSGTGQKSSEADMSKRQIGKHVSYSWGYRSNVGIGSNRSCGVSLLLDSKLFPSHAFNAAYSPPASSAGRGGAVRMKLPHLEVCVIGCYFAPDNGKPASKQTNKRLANWIAEVIATMPRRCLIVLAGDANAHLGRQRDGGDPMPCVGDRQQDLENQNGKI